MIQPTSSAHLTTIEVIDERRTLRNYLLQQRRVIDPTLRTLWNNVLATKLLQWCEQVRPTSLAVYSPIQHEPDLTASYSQISAMGIQLALPLVVAKNMPLQFVAWQVGDEMVSDEYGIAVPLRREKILKPEAMLIPCVGFNARHFRLGYGGGFYDRSLAVAPQTWAIGVAYQCLQSEFSEGQHDIAMHLILTELAT